MAIKCHQCKREFDVTLFEFERTVRCICGNIVTLEHKEMLDGTLIDRKEVGTTHRGRFVPRFREEKKIIEIKNLADKIAYLIVSTDYPMIDIEIEKQKFIDKINELFPDKIHLYDLIYEPRFKRLEEQFRSSL